MTGNIKIHPFFKTINWTLLEKRAVEPPFKPKVVRDLTPVGATHLILLSTAFQVGWGISFPSLSLSLHLQAFLLSILPANLLPGLPSTFCHCLCLCVLTHPRSESSQSVNKQWELWI